MKFEIMVPVEFEADTLDEAIEIAEHVEVRSGDKVLFAEATVTVIGENMLSISSDD